MASRRTACGTAITPAPAIIRCSCSTNSAISERCTLHPGNVHSADGWGDVLKPVIVRYQGKVLRIYFRADAAFAMPGDVRVPGS